MRCFIIDDHPGIVQMHAQILASIGVDGPEMFTDATEGLAALGTCTETCLVLLDLRMPGLHGDEILARLDKNDSAHNIHVVIISGMLDDMPDFVRELEHVQVEAIIPKPVRPEQLRDILQRLPD